MYQWEYHSSRTITKQFLPDKTSRASLRSMFPRPNQTTPHRALGLCLLRARLTQLHRTHPRTQTTCLLPDHHRQILLLTRMTSCHYRPRSRLEVTDDQCKQRLRKRIHLLTTTLPHTHHLQAQFITQDLMAILARQTLTTPATSQHLRTWAGRRAQQTI